jgi:hypothetical protein
MKQGQISKSGVWVSIGGIMAWGMEHGAWGIRQEADKWGMEPAACEDPPDGGDESREAGEHGQRVQGTEHGARGMGQGEYRS